MTGAPLDFAAWRARRLAPMPAPRTRLSPETQIRLAAYQVTAATARHAPATVVRYARQARRQRFLEHLRQVLALAATIAVLVAIVAIALSCLFLGGP
jgi:predicted lysophospholipase L1 biosynthesis ABC-type transport system permease subunit